MIENKLTSKLYRVRIPLLATYTEEELEIYGIPLDVEKGKANQDSYKNLTVCEITIDRMIDLYKDGYPIAIVLPNDSKEIFKTLEDYLHIHHNKIQHSVNVGFIQDDRLKDIDTFLTEIFDYNRNTIVKGMVSTGSGYGINMGLMQTPGTITNNQIQLGIPTDGNVTTGVMAGYRDTMSGNNVNNNNNNIYVQPNQVNIDMNAVKRRSVVKLGSGITASYLTDDNI